MRRENLGEVQASSWRKSWDQMQSLLRMVNGVMGRTGKPMRSEALTVGSTATPRRRPDAAPLPRAATPPPPRARLPHGTPGPRANPPLHGARLLRAAPHARASRHQGFSSRSGTPRTPSRSPPGLPAPSSPSARRSASADSDGGVRVDSSGSKLSRSTCSEEGLSQRSPRHPPPSPTARPAADRGVLPAVLPPRRLVAPAPATTGAVGMGEHPKGAPMPTLLCIFQAGGGQWTHPQAVGH